MNPSMPEPDKGQLRVRTRGEDDEALQSRLYVFDDTGQCVAMLSPDDNEQFVTADLSSGSYDLYGIGSLFRDLRTAPAEHGDHKGEDQRKDKKCSFVQNQSPTMDGAAERSFLRLSPVFLLQYHIRPEAAPL